MKPQRIGLGLGEPEHEVVRKALRLAFDRQVQRFRWDLIQFGQFAIHHDLLAADEVNPSLNQFDGRYEFPGLHLWT